MTKEHRIIVAIIIGFLILASVFLWGCTRTYPHIEWAEKNGVLYHVRPVKDAKYWGANRKVLGVHQIFIQEGWEDDKYILNHEIRHIRYPNWNH